MSDISLHTYLIFRKGELKDIPLFLGNLEKSFEKTNRERDERFGIRRCSESKQLFKCVQLLQDWVVRGMYLTNDRNEQKHTS